MRVKRLTRDLEFHSYPLQSLYRPGSHVLPLFQVTFFVITVAVPLTPIYNQDDLIPEWNEWLLLVWVSGVLVNELTGPGGRTGIARVRIVHGFASGQGQIRSKGIFSGSAKAQLWL